MRKLFGIALVALFVLACAAPAARAGELGPPIKINTNAEKVFRPSIATLPGGGFVVAWTTFIDYEFGPARPLYVLKNYGIYAQRYTEAGVPVGNTYFARFDDYTQPYVSVAGLADGGYILMITVGYGIEIIHVTIDGSPGLGYIPGKVHKTIAFRGASIAGLRDGSYVATWTSQDGIYGQRYRQVSNRLHVGAEFKINTTLGRVQQNPSVARLTDGGFVVTWDSHRKNNTDFAILGQRYSANGSRVGGEFRVSTSTTGQRAGPSTAGLINGSFVTVWQSTAQASSAKDGVYAQLFNAAGNRVGGEFSVDLAGGKGYSPSVTGLRNGGFLIVFGSTDGSTSGAYARRYKGNGERIGGPFKVAGTDPALNGSGFVVVRMSGNDIYVQRYGP